MYQNINNINRLNRPNPVNKVETVYRIDSIVEQSRIKAQPAQKEMASRFGNNPHAQKELTTKEELEQAANQANEALEAVNRQLVFQVHEGTGRPMIQLIESETQEVIREIPSEKMLDVVAGIWDLAGLIVDRKE